MIYKTNLIKDIRVDVTAEIGLEYHLKNNIALYFSLNYDSKGIDLKYRNTKEQSFIRLMNTINPISIDNTFVINSSEKYDVNIKNDYFIIPILIRKYLSNQKLYFQGGVYASYLLSSKSNINIESNGGFNRFQVILLIKTKNLLLILITEFHLDLVTGIY